MEDQDRDHISSRSHFSGRSEQELDEMLDELRAGKIGINQPGQNSSEHDLEDTPEENNNASGTGNAAKSKKGKSRKEGFNLKDEVISWIQVLVAAAIIAFCVNHFIIANSEVPTSSMETTIMAGDRVIGSRLSYKFGDPQRGDIAIFIYPDDEAKGIKTYYVKRIIGMPGDTIDIVDGKVYLNGSDTPTMLHTSPRLSFTSASRAVLSPWCARLICSMVLSIELRRFFFFLFFIHIFPSNSLFHRHTRSAAHPGLHLDLIHKRFHKRKAHP